MLKEKIMILDQRFPHATAQPLAIDKDGIKKEIIDKELEIIKAETLW